MLDVELPWLSDIGRPAQRRCLPVILSPDEVHRLLEHLPPGVSLRGRLLYGSRMRLMEGLRLRGRNRDFAQCAIDPLRALRFCIDRVGFRMPQPLAW